MRTTRRLTAGGQRPRRRPGRVITTAVMLATLGAVSACSDADSAQTSADGTRSSASVSSAATSTTPAAPTTPTATASATPSTPVNASTPAPTPTTPAGQATGTPAPTPTVDLGALVAYSCVKSAKTVSVAVTKWNTAVRSGSRVALRAAAKTLVATARALRLNAKAARDARFTAAAGKVAAELESISARYTAGRSVDGKALNVSQKAMIAYCQSRL